VDTTRVTHHPDDDTLEAHHSGLERLRPHGCYDGWIFLGFETEEDGELVQITDRVRCRRCEREDG
jgi:hypothetical protein